MVHDDQIVTCLSNIILSLFVHTVLDSLPHKLFFFTDEQDSDEENNVTNGRDDVNEEDDDDDETPDIISKSEKEVNLNYLSCDIALYVYGTKACNCGVDGSF